MNVWLRRLIGLGSLAAAGVLLLSVLHAQNPGSLAPVEKRQWLNDEGTPLSSGTISTYQTGGSTSAVTYTDAALNTRAANPVVLDSAGRATMFLSATQEYRFVVATSANVILYTQDNVRPVGYTVSQLAEDLDCHVRMTLTSGVPITTASLANATTIYATPYLGNTCWLYDGAAWARVTFTELSQSLGTDGANTNYDLFMVASGSVATLVRVAWANNLDRTTNLALQNGVLVQSGTPTRRYLGTYRTTATIGQTEDSFERRYVSNYYNTVPRLMRVLENANSWAYGANQYRLSNGSTVNVLSFVVGDTRLVTAEAVSVASTSSPGGANAYIAIGDGTVAPITGGFVMQESTTNAQHGFRTQVQDYARVGAHTWTWLERANFTHNWFGDDGNTQNELLQAGIWGWLSQ